MCGIVGYIGQRAAAPLLLDGLKNLEYRGYDSSGIAVKKGEEIAVVKTEGRLKNLFAETKGGFTLNGTIGIGHTRWATHGSPSKINAHPHLSRSGAFAIVHNGIIENWRELFAFLSDRGFTFLSDTDSEIISHLIEFYYTGNVIRAIAKTAARLKGSFALGIICKYDNCLYAIKRESPLVIGLGQNENYLASDIPALIQHTRKFVVPENNVIIRIESSCVSCYNLNAESVEYNIFYAKWDEKAAAKDGYPHFMLKEIFEQPSAVTATMTRYERFPIDLGFVPKKIHIIACGSAYHAGLLGKFLIEKWCRIPVNAQIASEFRYSDHIIQADDLAIAVSQSGETADTIGAITLAAQSCHTVSIVNVPESTLSRLSHPFYTDAGIEIAVATTKGYTTQFAVLCLLAASLAKKDLLPPDFYQTMKKLPENLTSVISCLPKYQQHALRLASCDQIFFLGRGADYYAAKESALKMKEISYIHAECYAAGELKHGTISLIQKGSHVIVIATEETLCDKIVSNIKEVKARGAIVTAITNLNDVAEICDAVFCIPQGSFTSPLLAVVAAQLLAYYTAAARGCDIDKPRNLAKSVTVE